MSVCQTDLDLVFYKHPKERNRRIANNQPSHLVGSQQKYAMDKMAKHRPVFSSVALLALFFHRDPFLYLSSIHKWPREVRKCTGRCCSRSRKISSQRERTSIIPRTRVRLDNASPPCTHTLRAKETTKYQSGRQLLEMYNRLFNVPCF